MARRFRHRNIRGRHHFQPRRRYSLFQRLVYFSRKHTITIGVILIIASLILFRLSFTNTFLNSSEVFMWSILLSIGLFIAGLLVLIGWWRNHISMFTTRHSVSWKNK
ncbi:MAG: hypothetical protein AABW50_05910 [Nanoarchaeota archaeon]